jgi:hypothetical protein
LLGCGLLYGQGVAWLQMVVAQAKQWREKNAGHRKQKAPAHG